MKPLQRGDKEEKQECSFFKLFESKSTYQVFESEYSNTKTVTCFFHKLKLMVQNKLQRTFGGNFPCLDTLVQTRVLTNQKTRMSHIIL